MIVKKHYSSLSKEDALRVLKSNIHWALKPIQVIQENGHWHVAEVVAAKILNQTVFIVVSHFLQYLATPEHFPEFYDKLKAVQATDPTLKGFAYEIAKVFDKRHPDLHGDEYTEALDEFIEFKVKALP
jgi:hypothetical protein